MSQEKNNRVERGDASSFRAAATRSEILAVAAELVGAGRRPAMSEIAAATGIARGTLYRHFPNRQALLEALEAKADENARSRLDDAHLDEVPVAEGLARAIRALVAGGAFFMVLRERPAAGHMFRRPLVDLLERGAKGGLIRRDVPLPIMIDSVLVLVGVCLRVGQELGMGTEDMSEAALNLVLACTRAGET